MSSARSFRRLAALRSPCPKCGVAGGKPCRGPRGDRRALHAERLAAVKLQPRRRPGQAVLALGDAPAAKAPILARGDFYLTDAWRTLRYQALRLHGGACQCCGAGPTPGHPLHVDHIRSRSRFPELALEISNLQVLCEDCNLGKGAQDETDWRPLKETL
jgi:hypothetical protein